MSTAAPQPAATVRDLFSAEQLTRGGDFQRALTLNRGAIDKEGRTVELSFSSEAPVLRTTWDGRDFWEVLDHTTVDTSRMDGAPLLYGHDRRDHLGTTLASSFGPDLKGRARVKFSRSTFAQEKFQDVEDGILTKTSVGYDLRNAEPVADGEREGIPVYRFRNWQPYEITLTPLPADTSVGVGRSKAPTESTRSNPSITMSETNSSAAATTEKRETAAPTQANDLSAERSRVKDLNAAAKVLAERHPDKAEAFRALAAKCAETGDSVAAFNQTVLNDILATQRTLAPVTQNPDAARVGLSAKDKGRYSILRAVRAIADGKPLDGLERECNDELTRKLERQPKGFFLPDDIIADRRSAQQRALNTGSPSDGGYTVGEELLVSEFDALLRNNTVLAQLGARVISGLQGNVTIPRQLTGATAYWVGESGAITDSNATFGQVIGKPRRLGTSVPYTKEFLAQTSLSADAFVVGDSDAAQAVELDRVALRGTGGAEPVGIANLAAADRSANVTFGAAPTWAKYLEFMANIAANNALTGSPAYVASVAAAVKAMTVTKFTNGDAPIWDGDMVGTFRARWTTQLLTSATPVANMVIFGDFSQVLYLEWAGRDVVVDPYSRKKYGEVEICIQRLVDVVIRRAKSFAISTDSGAQ